MAPLIYEMKKEKQSEVELSVLPGISAFQKAAALLGAPIGHDFCILSLSDLLTPWEKIEKRIIAASSADFVTAVYNPKSKERYWQLYRLIEIFLKDRSPQTPVGYVRQAGREEQEIKVTTLEKFNPEEVDMFTIIIIGNSQSFIMEENRIITPRGYFNETKEKTVGIGQDIMIRSFATIEKELRNRNIPIDKKWTLLHAIHTTADFEMENLLYANSGAVEKWYKALVEGKIRTIITDVSMVAAGIRKGALERLNIEVKCYLNDPRAVKLAKEKDVTRTQAGIQLAVEEHPDAFYVFGNAPTALMELCKQIRQGKACPSGIIAAPVGFVHVEESKHRVKSFVEIPKLIVEGRKGGSNLAATLVNSILTFDDAVQLKPGKDV
jgi:precorrin isomerase